MRDLTNRQREILNYIAQFTDDNSYAPTVREICEHFNISIRAVQDHIAALQKKGFLTLTKHRSRSLRVLNDQREGKNVPTFATIPIIKSGDTEDLLGEDNICGSVFRSASYIDVSKRYFAIHAKDDGMKDAGILENDVVVVLRSDTYRDGQIAVVFHEGSMLIRRVVKDGSRICLRAENDNVPPIFCRQVKVLGIVVEVSRAL